MSLQKKTAKVDFEKMKKSEWISLIIAVSSICLFLIASTLDYGGWRTFLGYLSFFVFMLSMGGWKNQEHGFNRVEKGLMILFFSSFAALILFGLLYCGFTDAHDGWIYLAFLVVILIVAGLFIWSFFLWKRQKQYMC